MSLSLFLEIHEGPLFNNKRQTFFIMLRVCGGDNSVEGGTVQ